MARPEQAPKPSAASSSHPPPAKPDSPFLQLLSSFFSTATPLYTTSIALRAVLILYGLWQDANSPLKYTDIDYLVFTDAARFVFRGHEKGPYARETYRYTPLLAWMLLPTTWTSESSTWLTVAYFSFGKVLFALADLVAGWLIVKVLTMRRDSRGSTVGMGMDRVTARKFAAIWLLNPMVATISTRGSSEGLLGVLVMALLWAVLSRRTTLAGLLLGFSVHFKIYPFIYAPAIVWWMDDEKQEPAEAPKSSSSAQSNKEAPSLVQSALAFITPARIKLAAVSLATFTGLNVAMYIIYGSPFLAHTFFHHVTRIDHRHNFSPYNILLYLISAFPNVSSSGIRIESVAFVPQLLLSCVLVPLVMAKKDLPTTMLAQTWTFVTFNKVCTSQYFLWYMVFLPLYLPRSSLLRSPKLGIPALALWVATQGAWLYQGFQLEFLGNSTFIPGLWVSAQAFFLANCWILSIIVRDVALHSES